MDSEPNIILINPPFLDPTAPPHFAAYLAGALRKLDIDANIRFDDLNVDLLNLTCTREFFENARKQISRLIVSINKMAALSDLDQLKLNFALQIKGISYKNIEASLRLLKTERDFYSFGKYQSAVRILTRYINSLTSLSLPGIFSLWDLDINNYGRSSSIDDLVGSELEFAITNIFSRYLDGYFRSIESFSPSVLGISCNYVSQLPYAAFLARRISEQLPSVSVFIGGTEVTDIYKNIRKKSLLWKLFPKSVRLVVGEGESAFSQAVISAGATVNHPNIISYDSTSDLVSAEIENINAIGQPAYDIYDYHKYWSPKPVLLYSPTRGCYWNKCTFCDYGLNFGMPTSPARQRTLAGLEADLLAIAEITDIAYFAVDAIPPSLLRRIANLIFEKRIPVKWSAEIRLEKTIADKKMGSLLTEGGCIGLSFGFESGSPSVLDRINKGVDLEKVPSLLSDLTSSNINVQLMGFVGFPNETRDDAEKTFDFLERYTALWSIAGIGSFVLTPGAMVAKGPQQYEISRLLDENIDIKREFSWVADDGKVTCGARNNDIRNRRAKELVRSPLSRPFVGGIDSAHTLLYFDKFRGAEAWRAAVSERENSVLNDAEVSLEFVELSKFFSLADLREARQRSHIPSLAEFVVAVSKKKHVKKGSATYIIKQSGRIYKRIGGNVESRWMEELYL